MAADRQELQGVAVVRLTFVVAPRSRIGFSSRAAVVVEGQEGWTRRARMEDSAVGQQEATAHPRASEDVVAVKSPEVPAELR